MSKVYDLVLDKMKELNEYQLANVSEYIDKLKNKKQHRSLNANNYLWQIIQQTQ